MTADTVALYDAAARRTFDCALARQQQIEQADALLCRLQLALASTTDSADRAGLARAIGERRRVLLLADADYVATYIEAGAARGRATAAANLAAVAAWPE